MDNYSVPTLSLSSSRAKRHSSIPTRDHAQMTSNQTSNFPLNYQNSKYLFYDHSHGPEPQERIRKTAIFPPKPPSTIQESSSKDINKNVYLNSPDHHAQIHPPNVNFSYQIQPPPQFQHQEHPIPVVHSSSVQGLLTNPQSSKLVSEEVSRVTTKKVDVGKMLFDRKLSKLLSEATFYE